MRLRSHILSLAGLLAAALIAPAAMAQSSTPLTVQDGNGTKQQLGEYKPDGTNLAGWTVKWVWTGSAWVLEPADTSGRPYVDVYSLPNVTLGAGSATIGNIGNTSFGISGTLPAFASTPTVNLGTLNGAAQDGTDATGVTPPTGGVGIRGWLSGIYKALTGTLSVSAATLPLPAGAATSANQTAIQSAAGTSASSLVTVQGSSSGVPIPMTCTSGCTAAGGSSENQPPGVAVPITATTYSQGQSLGGLLSVTSGSSGIVTYLALRSVDGLTISVADYVFSKNPTATTCTNGAPFALGAADRPYLVGGAPVVLTLAASGVGAADTASYAQAQNQTLNFVQQDTPTAGTVLYHCLVTESAIGTAPTANGLRLFQGNTQG